MKLLIIDSNEQFIRNFQKYLRDNNFNAIDIKSYTNIDTYLVDYKNQNDITYDILLCKDGVYDLISDQFNASEVLLLTGASYKTEYQNLHRISNYASAAEILAEINLLYASTGKRSYQRSERNTQIITFSSFDGAVGESTFAYLSALALAKKNKRILYLPLFADGIITPRRFRYDLTYILTDARDLSIVNYELERIKQVESTMDILLGFRDPVDFNVISKDQINKLISALKNTTNYDYIVISGLDAFHPCFEEILDYSNFLALITSSGYMETEKFNNKITYFENYLNKVDFDGKYKVLLNNARSEKLQSRPLDTKNVYQEVFAYQKSLKQVDSNGDLHIQQDCLLANLLTEFVEREIID